MKGISHQEAIDTLASERYLLDDMSELERHLFEEHYFSCIECAEAVREAAAMREAARLASSGPPRALTPKVLRKTRWTLLTGRPWLRPSSFVPLAAAATLALIVGYQSMVVIPNLQEGFAAQAIVPVVLRPATRGSEPAITISPDLAFVSLEPELTATPTAASLTFRLRTDSSDVVSGTAQRPDPGARLVLLVSTAKLTQTGLYVLSVHDGPADGPLLGEYNLTIQRQ
jgi:hypothetical protein